MKRAFLAAAVVLLVALAGCSKAPAKQPLHLFEDVAIGDEPATLTVLWPHGGKGPSYVNWVEDYRTNDGLGWWNITANTPQMDVQFSEGPYYQQGDGVRVKLFAWDSGVELIAATMNETNAAAAVPWISDFYRQLPDATYYLGEGDAPEGMEKLPDSVRGLAKQANDLLVGQPEGGVVSFKVAEEDWEFGWYIGELYIAAQITQLVQP